MTYNLLQVSEKRTCMFIGALLLISGKRLVMTTNAVEDDHKRKKQGFYSNLIRHHKTTQFFSLSLHIFPVQKN